MKGYFNTFYNAEDYFRKAEKLRQLGAKVKKKLPDPLETLTKKTEGNIKALPEKKNN